MATGFKRALRRNLLPVIKVLFYHFDSGGHEFRVRGLLIALDVEVMDIPPASYANNVVFIEASR
jgi:hypothetical protein